MKKVVQIIILVCILSGCGSLKQGWNNFTAYYNTFYNTKKFFNRGLSKNKAQVPDVNPLQPIRVYPSPTNAGLEDFESAISKGGSILRDHENSKFVERALFIIGKSYYYRSEFFAALEKFQELEAIASGELRQQAIFWQALTFLEMSNYGEGIELLEFELDSEEAWISNTESSAYVALGQLQAARENWETASRYLEESLLGLEDHTTRARTHFLLGQVFERMDEDTRALFSYRQINDLRASFDLEFNATRKQAEMSRRIGNYDLAVSLYRSMSRNDKYIDYRDDLQYEIARTLQLKGDYYEAIQSYNQVLSRRNQQLSNLTKAKTYFGLGEIYRDDMQNLQFAAAYFDSAASQRVDPTLLPNDFEARKLADSFGEYVSIKQNISEKDSLLNLAAMEPEELDRFVEELRQQKMEELEEEIDQIQEQRNRMLVVDQEQEFIEADQGTEYGFLNIESPTRLADASLQFQAIWGDRPLSDNWRRRAAVSGSRFDEPTQATEESNQRNGSTLAATGIQPTIDLSAIPFEEQQKEEMRAEIETLNYQVANVFFLSLDMPDSAKTYYRKVIDSGYDENLVSRSLYSIAELELLADNQEEALRWYEILDENNPGSIYSKRIAERLGLDREQQESIQEPLPDFIVNSNVDSLSAISQNTTETIQLSNSSESEEIRPFLLYEAAQDFMKLAKKEPGFDENVQQWFRLQEEIETQRNAFQELKDSSRVALTDTNLTEEQKTYWQQIADSTFSRPDLAERFPFEGAYWDSTRSILQEIETNYSASSVMPRVQILQATLAVPERDTTKIIQTDTREIRAEQEEKVNETNEFPRCEELGIIIDMEGGMDAFMNTLAYPSWTDDVSMRGELEYLFVIEPDGSIQSYEQLSRMDRSGIPQSVEEGFESSLKFSSTGTDQPVQCTMLFPINL